MDLCLCSGTGVVARILFCGQFLAAGRDAQAAAASTAQLARELTAYTEEDFRRLIQRNERVKTARDQIAETTVFAADIALRLMQGICTRPATGSQIVPRMF